MGGVKDGRSEEWERGKEQGERQEVLGRGVKMGW